MHLEIVTPEKKVFEGDADSAVFPGADGSFQILNSHAPLISLLKEGVVEYKIKGSVQQVSITGGVVEVVNNKVILLADGVKA